MAEFTIQYRVDAAFDETVERVTTALADAGFGVLCDVDVRATMREKLDAEFREYRILGVCNPPLAHAALDEELELGALLPCNVIVYERREAEVASTGASGDEPRADDGAVAVSAVDPGELLSVVEGDALSEVAEEVRGRFEAALGDVPGATPVDAPA